MRLAAENIQLLRQAEHLFETLDDGTYTHVVAQAPFLRVGAHLRHVIEFYECFLAGVGSAHIDYNSRGRDKDVEQNRTEGLGRVRRLIDRLSALDLGYNHASVFVTADDGYLMHSSVARELQALSSHTVHHYALIAATLQVLGVHVPSTFGVSPSTLRHREAAA
jgi:hypothetical protein